MEPRLCLQLFGMPQFVYQEELITDFISNKARALLIYLAVTGRPHSRDALFELLWADKPKAKRGSLTRALSNLRMLDGIELIEEGSQTVALDSDTYCLDVQEFTTLANQDALKNLAKIEQAIDLYQDDFLTGFNTSLSLGFEKWALAQQEQLRLLRCDLLNQLADSYIQQNKLSKAILTLRQWLIIEPWQEAVHYRVIELFARKGDIWGARSQYETCRENLRDELDVRPSPAIDALMEKILSGEFEPAIKSHTPTHEMMSNTGRSNTGRSNTGRSNIADPHRLEDKQAQFITGPPITQPHLFFGRNEALTRIFGWWQEAPLAHVALIGLRRSGKTSLLRYLQSITTTDERHLRPNQKQDWLTWPETYRWVWIDFQDPRMRNQERLLQHMLRGFGLDAPADCSLETFMDIAEFHHWTQPTIVLMDELGAGLAAPELDQAFWWMLRALSQSTNGYLAFMVACHDQPMRLAEDQGKTSPFFNIFTTLYQGPLTQDEASELIGSSPIRFDDADVSWILEESGCWPYLVQILCQERLGALERGDKTEHWRAVAQERMQPFLYLKEYNSV
ncbi:MAG: BTAD domain-containing putative transcriptional regulator [Chloroflexota bacterium]